MIPQLLSSRYLALCPELYVIIDMGKRNGTRMAALLYVHGPAGTSSQSVVDMDLNTDDMVETILDTEGQTPATGLASPENAYLPDASPSPDDQYGASDFGDVRQAGPTVAYRMALNALAKG
jgi:hypothetical protein